MPFSQTLFSFAVLACLALVLSAAGAPGGARAAEGEGSGPPILFDGDLLSDMAGNPAERKNARGRRTRDQADLIGGTLFQLEPFWFPVQTSKKGPVRYIAGRIQLVPAEDKIVDACYKLPWITEALILHYYRSPLDHAPEEGNSADEKQLARVVNAYTKVPLFKTMRIVPIDSIPRPISEEDRELSLVCN
ncbi:hypothetical protein IHV25_06470 [Phaeovibrio sulfidiphilus]|uniref:Uncharacterized protein n=1 Tax=Phaeovibrio sulfidiphilus TaxID=1220600 RepID=A0A8J6YMA8_9PROT|nr:hypothetical protein [Phaeovibrio sulfidiphilus]MBE1237288.1 hypothetical protein [Phaeovibrio sulfidiphilus]